MPIPSWPGSTARIPPPTPDLAGRPTRNIHSPDQSYMPHVAITVSTRLTLAADSARSPVRGLRPPLASVAAMTARSVAVTRIEHCSKYRSRCSSTGSSIIPELSSR